MTDSDKIPFAKLMGELSVVFGRDVDKPLLSVYFKHLEYLSLYQVSLAVNEIIENDDRFPVLSRIRTLAATKKKERPQPMSEAVQIEEVVMSNDLPRTKEDFFKAMDKLIEKTTF